MAPPDVASNISVGYLAFRHSLAFAEEWLGYVFLAYLWSDGMWILFLIALPHCIVFARRSHAALNRLCAQCGFPLQPERRCPFLALPWENWKNSVFNVARTN